MKFKVYKTFSAELEIEAEHIADAIDEADSLGPEAFTRFYEVDSLTVALDE